MHSYIKALQCLCRPFLYGHSYINALQELTCGRPPRVLGFTGIAIYRHYNVYTGMAIYRHYTAYIGIATYRLYNALVCIATHRHYNAYIGHSLYRHSHINSLQEFHCGRPPQVLVCTGIAMYRHGYIYIYIYIYALYCLYRHGCIQAL